MNIDRRAAEAHVATAAELAVQGHPLQSGTTALDWLWGLSQAEHVIVLNRLSVWAIPRAEIPQGYYLSRPNGQISKASRALANLRS